MPQPQPEIQVFDIDHLGIVAGIIDEIGLVEAVNELIESPAQAQVSLGHVLKAMLLNGLGFVSAPLYLFGQFFSGKATEHLIGAGIQPSHLNDDRLGRALDKFHDYGVTKLFTTLAMKAARQCGVAMTSVHLDSSSFHVDGQYRLSAAATATEGAAEPENGESAAEVEEPSVIQITHGYSRDHRPDLKQFLLDTICSADGDVPLYLRVGDGNEADKTTFPQVIADYRKQWTFDGLYVADSALYSAENLDLLKQVRWLSRVPLTLNEAKQVLRQVQEQEWMSSATEGYRIGEFESKYGGIEQRWFVVESAARRDADLKQLDKRVTQQFQQQQAKLRALCAQEFACEPDARKAAHKFEQSLRHHRLNVLKVVATSHHERSGRPRRAETPSRYTYRIQATLVPNPEAIEAERTIAGRFLLATNVLDSKTLSSGQALQEYKDQQANERGFRFLKDPLFFTSSVFLKSPQRVMAVAMVMALSLLVYSLAQRKLRQALEAADTGINNQLGKPTQRPTLRWVFQCFQSVHLLLVNGMQRISNLTAERQTILRFLGSACGRYYLLS
jgi:transposase